MSMRTSNTVINHFSQDLLAPTDVQTTGCYLGDSLGNFEDEGYMFLEGWEETDIKWNDKKRLKVTDLKNNTDYEVKFYD